MKVNVVTTLVFLATMNGVGASDIVPEDAVRDVESEDETNLFGASVLKDDPTPYEHVYQEVTTHLDGVSREMTVGEAEIFAAKWRIVYNTVHANNKNYDVIIDSVTVDRQLFQPYPSAGDGLRGSGEGGTTTWSGVTGSCSRCDNGVPPDMVQGSMGLIADDILLQVTQDELCAALRESDFPYFHDANDCTITYVSTTTSKSSSSSPAVSSMH